MSWTHYNDGVLSKEFYRDLIPSYRTFCPYTKSTPVPIASVIGCSQCKKNDVKTMRCSGCSHARYCSSACQASAWPGHQKICRPPNASDKKIDIIWELMGMHFARGEFETTRQAAVKIITLSSSSMRWERVGQQKRLNYMLEPYLSGGIVPQRGTRVIEKWA
ncbi:hypothetical protein T484DRAFT_1647558 [Baffinella frigidus]|nr:hypothetical protein T484DRAFT_1647558 [Cryptophyta sp. CCMP2293]